MALNETALNIAADAIADAISHIGLVDDQGAEITGGTYSRQAVTWTAAADGAVAPTGDLTFDVPGGNTVAGWQGYSASEAGTAYGVTALTNEAFTGDGHRHRRGVMSSWVHDPDATEWIPVDWSSWLADGDAISTVEWITDLDVLDQAHTGTVARAKVAGGTLGEEYKLVCRVTTVGGETNDYTVRVFVRER